MITSYSRVRTTQTRQYYQTNKLSTATKNVSTISNVLTIFRNLRKTSTCYDLETMQENANALQTIVMVINLQESEIHYLSRI